MEEKPHWLQVLALTLGELVFAVIAIPLYIFFVLPKYPEGSLPGFSPIIADGVSPAAAIAGAIGVLALSLGLVLLLCRAFGYDKLKTDEVELLMQGFSVLDLVPIFAAAGFAEEFLFRVVCADVLGLLASAALFTAVHLAYWKKPLLLLDVFVLALVLGAFYLFTKSLLLCAIAHGAYNLLVAVFMKNGWLPTR